MSLDAKVPERICNQLRVYLSEQFGLANCHCHEGTSYATIDAQSEYYDIYLRVPAPVSFWPESTLVIARMSFEPPRCGHGRRFLQFLVDKADEFMFKKIGIEATNESSNSFGQRFGMLPYQTDNCLIADVSFIRTHLSSPTFPRRVFTILEMEQ